MFDWNEINTINFTFKTYIGIYTLTLPTRWPVVKNPPSSFDPWLGKIPWRRKWQPTPVVLHGEVHGQRSLMGTIYEIIKESDMTERLKQQWQYILDILKMFFFCLWPYHAAYRILVPWPEIKPMSPAVEMQSLNHWPAREVSRLTFWV